MTLTSQRLMHGGLSVSPVPPQEVRLNLSKHPEFLLHALWQLLESQLGTEIEKFLPFIKNVTSAVFGVFPGLSVFICKSRYLITGSHSLEDIFPV